MRFRKICWGSWWWLGELYEVPRCPLWRDWGIIVLCTMFLVSCIFSKCFYFSHYLARYLLGRPHIIQPSCSLIFTEGKIWKEVKNSYPHKNLHMDVLAAIFITGKTWKQPTCPSLAEPLNCGASRQWNVIQCYKEMSYQAVVKHGPS